ncbi:MAG: hypothetical protein J6J12_06455 [Oscillospiraceae bacterium]|nr:hypothetical protein [Oscillospiraceae bacterium]
MKRKWIFPLIPLLLLALLLFPGSSDYLSVIEANWELSFPENAGWVLAYQTDSGPSPHGDGWRYHVYHYGQENAVAAMLPWSRDTGTTVFSESYADACESWLDEISVPADWRPDYESCQVYYAVQKDNSQLLIWWNPSDMRISVAEFFI